MRLFADEKIFAIDEIIREEARRRMFVGDCTVGGAQQGHQSGSTSQDDSTLKFQRPDNTLIDSNKYSDHRGRQRFQQENQLHQSRISDTYKSSDRYIFLDKVYILQLALCLQYIRFFS